MRQFSLLALLLVVQLKPTFQEKHVARDTSAMEASSAMGQTTMAAGEPILPATSFPNTLVAPVQAAGESQATSTYTTAAVAPMQAAGESQATTHTTAAAGESQATTHTTAAVAPMQAAGESQATTSTTAAVTPMQPAEQSLATTSTVTGYDWSKGPYVAGAWGDSWSQPQGATAPLAQEALVKAPPAVTAAAEPQTVTTTTTSANIVVPSYQELVAGQAQQNITRTNEIPVTYSPGLASGQQQAARVFDDTATAGRIFGSDSSSSSGSEGKMGKGKGKGKGKGGKGKGSSSSSRKMSERRVRQLRNYQ